MISAVLLSVFLMAMIGVGYWGMKRTTTLADFFLGGRNIGPWFSAFAYGTTYSRGPLHRLSRQAGLGIRLERAVGGAGQFLYRRALGLDGASQAHADHVSESECHDYAGVLAGALPGQAHQSAQRRSDLYFFFCRIRHPCSRGWPICSRAISICRTILPCC